MDYDEIVGQIEKVREQYMEGAITSEEYVLKVAIILQEAGA